MDTADKFINNKAPKKLLKCYVVSLLLLCISSFIVSQKYAEYITKQHINTLVDLNNRYSSDEDSPEGLIYLIGINKNSSPNSFDIYDKARNKCMIILLIFSFSICTGWYLISTKEIFHIYSELEMLTDEIEEIKETGGPLKHNFGTELDCIRRTSDAVSGMGKRMSYLTGKLTDERDFLKEFLSDFSHQLKTSLSVIRLNNDMLDCMDNLTEEKAIQLSEEINESCDDMESLIFSALKLAKLNSGAIAYEMNNNDLSEVCRKSVSKVKALLCDKNISLINDYDKKVMWVFDGVWLSEAIANLIKNAADHSQCTEIKISLTETAVSAVIAISDNGIGIPQSSIPGLFKRFGKVSRESGMNSVGIGMSISEKIIREHNGEILVYSSEGNGTTFEVVLLKQ